jgi:hypothetical protein
LLWNAGSTYTLVLLFLATFSIYPLHFATLVGFALRALHHVVASSLSSVDVKNLPGDKPRAIQVEYRVYDVGHISHLARWM